MLSPILQAQNLDRFGNRLRLFRGPSSGDGWLRVRLPRRERGMASAGPEAKRARSRRERSRRHPRALTFFQRKAFLQAQHPLQSQVLGRDGHAAVGEEADPAGTARRAPLRSAPSPPRRPPSPRPQPGSGRLCSPRQGRRAPPPAQPEAQTTEGPPAGTASLPSLGAKPMAIRSGGRASGRRRLWGAGAASLK